MSERVYKINLILQKNGDFDVTVGGGIFEKNFYCPLEVFHQNIFTKLKVIQTLNFAKIVHFCDYLENGALW